MKILKYKTYKALVVTGWTFIFLSLVALLIGFTTYAWPSANGYLDQATLQKLESARTWALVPSSHRGSDGAARLSYFDARYSYSVGDDYFENRLICICLPFAIPLQEQSGEGWATRIDVRYAPYWHGLSVIVPGPDIKLVGLLLLIGLALIQLDRSLGRTIQNLSTDTLPDSGFGD